MGIFATSPAVAGGVGALVSAAILKSGKEDELNRGSPVLADKRDGLLGVLEREASALDVGLGVFGASTAIVGARGLTFGLSVFCSSPSDSPPCCCCCLDRLGRGEFPATV